LLSIVAMIAALGVLALVIAQWGWQWFGPAPATLDRVTASGDDARRITEAHLFGAAPAVQAGAAAPASGDLRLLGIIAERDGRGYALFRSARGPLLASAGQDIGAGVRLEAVRPDGVTLMDGGARRENFGQTFHFEQSGSTVAFVMKHRRGEVQYLLRQFSLAFMDFIADFE